MVVLDGPAPGVPDRVYRHHLDDISDEADVVDRLLQEQVPMAGLHVWRWFLEVRVGSLDGLSNTITYQDIYQWSSLMKLSLEAWEARALVLMSLAYVDEKAKLEGDKKDGQRT